MDLISKVGLQDPFYPKSIIVTTIEEIEQRLCCIEENCCDEAGDGILKTNTSGPDHTQIWSSVVNIQPVGPNNLIIGNNSSSGATGINNVLVGNRISEVSAGADIGNEGNTIIGQDAGHTLDGGDNVIIGFEAARSDIAGALMTNVVCLGRSAMENAGNAVVTGVIADDVAIGHSALSFIGKTVTGALDRSHSNVAIGSQAMFDFDTNTTENTAIGTRAFMGNGGMTVPFHNAQQNTVIGYEAGSHAHGEPGFNLTNNIIVGPGTARRLGSTNVTEDTTDNIIIGGALASNISGVCKNLIAIGKNILTSTPNGEVTGEVSPILIGRDICNAPFNYVSSGGSTIGIGTEALDVCRTSSSTIAIGHKTLKDGTDITNSIAIGDNVGENQGPTIDGENVLIGNGVLKLEETGEGGHQSVIIGEKAAENLIASSGFKQAVVIGHEAGGNASGVGPGVGDRSVLIGEGINVHTAGSGGTTTSNYVSVNDAFRAWNSELGAPAVQGKWTPFIAISDGVTPFADHKPGEISIYITGASPTFTLMAKYRDPVTGNAFEGPLATLV